MCYSTCWFATVVSLVILMSLLAGCVWEQILSISVWHTRRVIISVFLFFFLIKLERNGMISNSHCNQTGKDKNIHRKSDIKIWLLLDWQIPRSTKTQQRVLHFFSVSASMLWPCVDVVTCHRAPCLLSDPTPRLHLKFLSLAALSSVTMVTASNSVSVCTHRFL